MNHALGVSLCLLAVSLSGCHGSDRNNGMTVVVEGSERFPAALAGRWQADRDGWEFVITPDGRIGSAILSLGRVRVMPGQTTTIPTVSGGEGVFEPGAWTVYYEPDAGELTIKVAMDHVRVEMREAILEGATIDIFSGLVSATDGVWQAQWSAFNTYTVQGGERSGTKLATHPEYGETKALTFQRAAEP